MATAIIGQTTGKIAGKIIDKNTREPLAGVNVYIPGTYLGTVSDIKGHYYLINVTPGKYDLKISIIGYADVIVPNVLVSINRTINLEIEMEQAVLEGQEIVVEVDPVSRKKDQTGTIKNVSSDQISTLPIEDLRSVIGMQAGVVDGHFRGGRITEVSYLVDGIQVDDVFGGEVEIVTLEPEVVQDLEVLTGTFNAEYGRAMSGVVNAVTKDGGDKFEGSASVSGGSYITSHNNIFIGLPQSDNFIRKYLVNHSESEIDLIRNKDYKFQLSGPILSERITFFTNIRFQNNKNHLNGVRRFNVRDYSNYYSSNPLLWVTEASGDSSYQSLNGSENLSFMGKLSFQVFKNIRFSYLYTRNDDNWDSYNHIFKYNPDGKTSDYASTNFQAFQLNHMLSNKLFYDIKISRSDNYYGNYVFKNPLDSNYVHDKYLESYGVGFFTGGQEKNHTERFIHDEAVKLDVTWQMTNNHDLKFGSNYTEHVIDNRWHLIRNLYSGLANQDEKYEPEIFGDSTVYGDVYKVKPIELSAYIQDKMEFNNMVINVGIRYDQFDPNKKYPSDWRNPSNQLSLPDSMMSFPVNAPSISQLSPRFGLAYQLGGTAVLHFSYGHFFQMPPMYALYTNNSYLIGPADFTTTVGNPLLKPEKTITYEIGLWQELTRDMGIEVSLFYKDIYNLLSSKIISTYNQIEYGLYSNKDYANARGIEVKYDLKLSNIAAYVNYTLQYTRGNADYPTQAFDREGNSQDPVNRFIPMSWDQRHTLNATLVYAYNDFNISLTGYYNSGTPYTFSPLAESVLSRVNLYPNNDKKPSTYAVDLTSSYQYSFFKIPMRFTLSIYNLFDRLNEVTVNSGTGRAYTAIVRESDIISHRSEFNSYKDIIQNPSMYAAPRLIKFGVGIAF